MKRREFLGLAAGAAAMGGCRSLCGGEKPRILFGACRGLRDVPLMKEAGYDFFEGSVGGMLIPDKDDEAWKKQKEAILAAPLPMRSCNGFLPGKFRLTGPKASFDEPLAYAAKACARADEVGLKTIVFGSGGARNAPEGFPKDQAVEQFTDFCRKLALRVAGCRVTIVLEPLQPKEANFLNFVREGAVICRKVGSPRIRLLADIFHMEQGDEGPESIRAAGALIMHCHIAEKGPRTAPGLSGDGSEFIPYFAALKEIGYAGGVSCECGWGDKKDFARNLATALETMKRVADQA
ncbi:MAG: sugar phosphate isomerase/epimerase family protein [Kiritimatiellia bacterium]